MGSIVLAAALAGVLSACGSSAPPSGAAGPPASATPDPAARSVLDVDVGSGRTIQIVCAGPLDTGRPTIVFENGAGPTLATWSRVMDQLMSTDRACAYDRAGVGRSDPPPGSRTTRDQVADLAATLQGAGVTGPIVLVAHSRGAWNAIIYTADHPEQVAGVVLVDADPPGLQAAWLAELPPAAPDEDPTITEARQIMSSQEGDPSVTNERLDLEASAQQVLAAPGFGGRPVEILWATKSGVTEWPVEFGAELTDRLNAVYEDLQSDIEALSDAPNVTLVDTGHSIQEEQPPVVVEAIRRVLEALAPA